MTIETDNGIIKIRHGKVMFFIYNKECKVAFENKNKNLKKCVDKTKYTWYYIEVVADKNKKRQKII